MYYQPNLLILEYPQAYVLYLFFALLMGYVSNGDEYALVAALESEAMSAHINLTSSRPKPTNSKPLAGGKSRMKKMSIDPQNGEQFLRYSHQWTRHETRPALIASCIV